MTDERKWTAEQLLTRLQEARMYQRSLDSGECSAIERLLLSQSADLKALLAALEQEDTADALEAIKNMQTDLQAGRVLRKAKDERVAKFAGMLTAKDSEIQAKDERIAELERERNSLDAESDRLEQRIETVQRELDAALLRLGEFLNAPCLPHVIAELQAKYRAVEESFPGDVYAPSITTGGTDQEILVEGRGAMAMHVDKAWSERQAIKPENEEFAVERRGPLPVCMMPDGGQCCNYHRTGGDWRAECGGEDFIL